MRIVKLDAVDSTNDFLKNLCREKPLDNFTVVTAENQTGGRGQMGSKWLSEPSQNLTVSVLIKNAIDSKTNAFDLNIVISVAIAEALKAANIPAISIKWPNDILSGRKKIGGILIENLYRNDGEVWSIAGFGINVNQLKFEGLPKASSLRIVSGNEFDRDQLLLTLLKSIKGKTEKLQSNAIASLTATFQDLLFRRNEVSSFSDVDGKPFNGIIRNVNRNGLLEVELENSEIKHFSLKEIEMLY